MIKMISKENFWDTDLSEIESSFLKKGKKITDLPAAFNESVPEQGSVLLHKTINIENELSPAPTLFDKILNVFK